MQTNFPVGIATFRHPHESEDPNPSGLSRRMIALVFAIAFPVASPALADVHAWRVVPGSGLGPSFNDRPQVRGLIEAGIIF